MLAKNNKKIIRICALLLSCLLLFGTVGCRQTEEGGSDYEIVTSTILRPVGGTEDGNVSDLGTNGSGTNGSGTNGSGTNGSGTNGSSGKVDINKVETSGKTFTILSRLLPEKETKNSTVFEKVFFKRVAEVEKEYGCKIKIVNNIEPTVASLAPMIQSGKQVANVLEVELDELIPLLYSGYIREWNGAPFIDMNASKFTASYTRMATVNNKNYGLQFMKPPELRMCVVMNKTLLKSKGIDADGIYTLINNKQWTFDKMLEYAKATTSASKGVYGIGGDIRYMIQMLLAGNNANLVTVDSNGKATSTYTSKKVLETLDYFNQIVNVDKVFSQNSKMFSQDTFYTASPDFTDQFIKGKLAFLFQDSWVINQTVRPKVKNFDYGMITIPLGPSGTEYVSPSSNARVFVMTSTNKEVEFTAKIFNALSELPKGYEGDDWWKDEIQLDYFQSNDTQSKEVYMKLLDNATVDYGVTIDTVWEDFMKEIYGSVFWKNGKTPSAMLDSINGKYDKYINALFKK